ncbi:N-acetyltransferase domain-containing protein [Mycena sanguinolenta]|uniref:N-acetyltransferase domain-containing protein n=1 Tax=Mycena sanguinolenta TaxID=230812 RepID=A0A8H6Z858_9AGAR|nr:N-acetyltransferase domain-containing protein [Mycena sanguinolenta]
MTSIIFDPSNEEHIALIPSFADIHIACIETDHTIATFTPPLKRDVIIDWWKDRVRDAIDGKRIIIMVLAEDAEGKEQLAGYVVLYRPLTETGPFRGVVEKLLVSPNFRRRGLARMLMEKLEEEAKIHGQTLLTLDTETGSPAEIVYPKLGYIKLGIIPNYGISPLDGSLIAGTFFWKQL